MLSPHISYLAEPPSYPEHGQLNCVIDTIEGIDQIPAELIKAEGRKIYLEIHKLITSVWKKEKLPEG
jgi:hypothetical protein